VGQGDADIRSPLHDPRSRRKPSLKTPRRHLRAGIPTEGISAGSTPELSGPAGLVHRGQSRPVLVR